MVIIFQLHDFISAAQHVVNQCDDQSGSNIHHERNIILSLVRNLNIRQCNTVIFMKRIDELIVSALLHFHHGYVCKNPEYSVYLRSQNTGIIFKDAVQYFYFVLCKLSWTVEIIFTVLCLFGLQLLFN